MKIGKLTNEELKRYIFKNLTIKRKESIQASAIGSDTAVLNIDDDLIVASVDPITGASKNLAKLSVNVACNDIACQGAEAVGLLVSALIPLDYELEDLEDLMKDIDLECKKLNVDVIGGHTEITDAVNKLILTVTSIGRIKKSDLIDPSSVKNSDIVCVSKDIALEGTSIIYNEKDFLLDEILSQKEKEELEDTINHISVVEESKIAMKHGVKYMHDITEGGIYGGLLETANFLNKKILAKKENIPIRQVTKKITQYLSIDPYRLISSGSMIFVFDKDDYKNFKEECDQKNIKTTIVGQIDDGSSLYILDNNEIKQINDVSKDELYRIIK